MLGFSGINLKIQLYLLGGNMKEKISVVKLTEKQEQAVKGGVDTVICEPYPPIPNCGCYIGIGRCAHQLWPKNNICF